jgi:hypothetical protein
VPEGFRAANISLRSVTVTQGMRICLTTGTLVGNFNLSFCIDVA